MRTHSFSQARITIQENLQVAINEHRKAAASLGVRHGGRPTKYRPELAVLAYSILTDFRTVATTKYVAAMLGVSRSTLYEWIHAHDEMRVGIEWGKSLQECWLATLLLHAQGNQRGILFALTHLHGWRNHFVNHTRKNVDIADAMRKQELDGKRLFPAIMKE